MKLIGKGVVTAAVVAGSLFASGEARAWMLVTSGDGYMSCIEGACSDYADQFGDEFDCLDVTDQPFFSSCSIAVSGGGGVLGSDLLHYASIHPDGVVGAVGNVVKDQLYSVHILPNGQLGVVLGRDPTLTCSALDGGGVIQDDPVLVASLEHLYDKTAALQLGSCTTQVSTVNAYSHAEDQVADTCAGLSKKDVIVKLSGTRAAVIDVEPITSAVRSVTWYDTKLRRAESILTLAYNPKAPKQPVLCRDDAAQPDGAGQRWYCAPTSGNGCHCNYWLFGVSWTGFDGTVVYENGQRYCESNAL